MNCPLGIKKPSCPVCPFSKQKKCDYPYIGAEKCEIVEVGHE